MSIIITGSTGLIGSLLLEHLEQEKIDRELLCVIRETSNTKWHENLNLNIKYSVGDSSKDETWHSLLKEAKPETIIHIASIRHIEVIVENLYKLGQTPRLIVVGTTGIYSKYRESAETYQKMESILKNYSGSYCLVRPTMIYGSYRDKNLHKLIKFCDRYGFFPVFGSGNNLLQPIHADDIAKTLLYAWQNLNIQGAYDISGESIVNFRELLALVEKLIDKPVRPIFLPLNLGIFSATIVENILKEKSPVRREQILRLQEDKAYPHDAAKRDLEFSPRSLEVGLKEEVELMRSEGIISA